MKSNTDFDPGNISRKSFLRLLGGASSFFLIHKNASAALAETSVADDFPPFVPREGANKPIGIPKGIMPGRVAWAWDPKAAHWNEGTGTWWDASSNDQGKIDEMVSRAMHSIANESSTEKSWNALFKFFNRSNGGEDRGHARGEKIALKVNLNNDRTGYDDTPWINTSPQVVNAVLHTLVRGAGVREEDITVFDSSRYMTPHFHNYVHDAFPGVVFVDSYGGLPGRIKATWAPDRITYAVKTQCGTSVPTCVVEARYLINMYAAKGHPSAGVTLSGKNHYGSIDGREHSFIKVKEKGYDHYNPLVDLMGHKDLGGKTILNVCDLLYGCYHSDALPIKWKMAPFKNAWPSSILMSQDSVANDSVALDFLTTEFSPRTDIPTGVNVKGKKVEMTNCDAVLHEAAQAGDPPSGIVYAPNGDGVRLKSLGVHEHWNNAEEKRYSGNTGSKNGIELLLIKG
jgi:hypothetical protein